MSNTPRSSRLRRIWTRRSTPAAVGVLLVTVAVLAAMGRSLWCQDGDWIPWSWDIWSTHNSQHLLDPYSFTHFQHGLAAYALLWLVLGSRWQPAQLVLAIAFESVWEIFENTDSVINAYRESTIALNYYGDSISNSVSDIAAFSLGYGAALVLGWRIAAALFVVIEVGLLLAVRDSLILNIVMLLHPLEAIKLWQMGGV